MAQTKYGSSVAKCTRSIQHATLTAKYLLKSSTMKIILWCLPHSWNLEISRKCDFRIIFSIAFTQLPLKRYSLEMTWPFSKKICAISTKTDQKSSHWLISKERYLLHQWPRFHFQRLKCWRIIPLVFYSIHSTRTLMIFSLSMNRMTFCQIIGTADNSKYLKLELSGNAKYHATLQKNCV